jgi:nitrilase
MSNEKVSVAAIQMVSGPVLEKNLDDAATLVEVAAKQKARLIVLPENFALMGDKEEDKVAIRETEGSGRIQEFCQQLCRDYDIYLVAGTVPLKSDDPNKVFATTFVYGPGGETLGRYDKIHLFDVRVPDTEDQYLESETIAHGQDSLVVETPFGKLGIAVCYDLRFPELFRSLVDKGAEIIAIPSAFTEQTGRDHWETLLRARAIENSCYVVAPNQGGKHSSGRETYGDSLIIDPWGRVINRLAKGPGIVMGDMNLKRLRQLRTVFPVLEHRRI